MFSKKKFQHGQGQAKFFRHHLIWKASKKIFMTSTGWPVTCPWTSSTFTLFIPLMTFAIFITLIQIAIYFFIYHYFISLGLLWDIDKQCRPRMWRLISVSTVCLQNLLLKFEMREKIPLNSPKIGNEIALLIRVGMSILLNLVKVYILWLLIG